MEIVRIGYAAAAAADPGYIVLPHQASLVSVNHLRDAPDPWWKDKFSYGLRFILYIRPTYDRQPHFVTSDEEIPTSNPKVF